MDNATMQLLRRLGVPGSAVDRQDLNGVNLSQKVLIGVDLRGSSVSKANFERTDFTSADLRGVQFATANCVAACFAAADLRGARLSFGYFHGADFRGADLRGAFLKDGVCNGCSFAGADLRGAVFGHEHYDSDFRGADLRGALLPDDCDFGRLNCDMRGALLTPREAAAHTNKRRSPRIQLLRPLRVFDRTTGQQVGVLVDITTEGIRITSQRSTPVGHVFDFQIQLPEGTMYGRSLNMEARSVWCRPAANTNYFNVGFHIEKMDERDLRIIERLIEDHKSMGYAVVDK